jgi:hypothetical protein
MGAFDEGDDRFDEGESFGRYALGQEILPLLKAVAAASQLDELMMARFRLGLLIREIEGGGDD